MNPSVTEAGSGTAPGCRNVLQEYFHGVWNYTDARRNFWASPTDLLMTPCTAKLYAHKQMRCNKYVSTFVAAEALL